MQQTNRKAVPTDSKSAVKNFEGINQEDFTAFTLYNDIKSYGAANAIIDYAIHWNKKGQISKRITGLLIRGAVVDFGAGKYNEQMRPELISMIRTLGKEELMYQPELNSFNALPEILTIYRGGKTNSIFWTLSEKWVIYFAQHLHFSNIIYGTIEKSKVLFFMDLEGGLIIADPNDVKNLTSKPLYKNSVRA